MLEIVAALLRFGVMGGGRDRDGGDTDSFFLRLLPEGGSGDNIGRGIDNFHPA